MKTITRCCLFIIAVELVAGIWLAGRALQRPQPPLPDMGKLDAATADWLMQLRNRIRTGSAGEWQSFANGLLGYRYFVEAEQCYRQAMELAPDSASAPYGRGVCLSRLGRTDESTKMLKHAARIGDREMFGICWYQIGLNYLREENAEQAEAAFRFVADFPSAAYQRAKLRVHENKPQEAIELIEPYLERFPDSLKFLQLRVRLASMARDDAAYRMYRQQQDLAVRRLGLRFETGFMDQYRSPVDLSQQLESCNQMALSAAPADHRKCLESVMNRIRRNELWNYPTVFVAAAVAELDLGHPNSALELLDEVHQYANESPQTVELRGDALLRQGHNEEARREWGRAVRMQPTPALHMKLADAARDRRENDIATTHVARAVYLQGLASYRSNQPEAAQSQLRESIAKDSNFAPAWYYLGQVCRILGDDPAAVVAWERCLSINPDHGRAIAALKGVNSENNVQE